MASPFNHKTGSFARVDQGVDWQQTTPYVAAASGTVVKVGHHAFAGGTGDVVYIKLDKPVKINGRTYTGLYYAEQTPLVKEGDHVKEGQPIMQGGGAELGFANGATPVAPLVGGLGAGTKPSQAGYDFLAWTKRQAPGGGSQATAAAAAQAADTAPATDTTAPAAQSVPDPTFTAPPPTAGGTPGPDVQMPGSVNYTTNDLANLWDTVAAQSFVSPDTRLFAQNASILGG